MGFLLAANQTDHPFLSPCSRFFRSLCGIKGCMTLRESGFWSLPNSGKKIAGHTCDLNSGNTHHFRKRTGLLKVKSQTGNIADPRVSLPKFRLANEPREFNQKLTRSMCEFVMAAAKNNKFNLGTLDLYK